MSLWRFYVRQTCIQMLVLLLCPSEINASLNNLQYLRGYYLFWHLLYSNDWNFLDVRLLPTHRMTTEFCSKSAYIFGIFSFYKAWEVIVQPSGKSDLREEFHP